MFGKRKRRIAELEQQLEEARRDLAIAVVPLGPLRQKFEVRKGAWYRVAFSFRHTGAPFLDLTDLFVGADDGLSPYFEGTTPQEGSATWIDGAIITESRDAEQA